MWSSQKTLQRPTTMQDWCGEALKLLANPAGSHLKVIGPRQLSREKAALPIFEFFAHNTSSLFGQGDAKSAATLAGLMNRPEAQRHVHGQQREATEQRLSLSPREATSAHGQPLIDASLSPSVGSRRCRMIFHHASSLRC
jgi:hypothetical protein